MRLSPLALYLLLTASLSANAAFAQSTPGRTTWTVQAGTSLPADWVLSNEAKMARKLAAERAQTASIAACPVGFSAQRQGAWGPVATRHPSDPGAPHVMGLDLSFGTPRPGSVAARVIVEAGITAYGWSSQLRIIPAAYPPETSESFVLNGTKDEPLMQELVWMKRLGVVNSVELTRLVFSDGTTWTPAGQAHCVALPSKVMLVGGLK